MADLTKAQLEEKLAAAEKALEVAQAQSGKRKFPAILTRSQLEELEEPDRQKFRFSGGTVIEDAAAQ